jgi:hypothetical protein
MRVKFYYKDDCWLCANMEEQLSGITERYGLVIERIDIAADDELYELYRFDIPVVEFPDGTELFRRIRRADLLDAIARNQGGPG